MFMYKNVFGEDSLEAMKRVLSKMGANSEDDNCTIKEIAAKLGVTHDEAASYSVREILELKIQGLL